MQHNSGYKKQNMSAREKYEALENKKEKLTAESQALYARIDILRVKLNQLEAETQEAFKKIRQEIKPK